MLLVLVPMPFAVWGIDEIYRWWLRSRATRKDMHTSVAADDEGARDRVVR